jgi:hypothetical protein
VSEIELTKPSLHGSYQGTVPGMTLGLLDLIKLKTIGMYLTKQFALMTLLDSVSMLNHVLSECAGGTIRWGQVRIKVVQ